VNNREITPFLANRATLNHGWPLLPALPTKELGLHGGPKRRHQIRRLHGLLEVTVNLLSCVVAARAAPRAKAKQKPHQEVGPVDSHEHNHHFACSATCTVFGGAIIAGVFANPHRSKAQPNELHDCPQNVACHTRVVAYLREQIRANSLIRKDRSDILDCC